MVLAQALDPLKHNEPCIFERIGFAFDLACDEIGYILEHTNCWKVTINVIASVTGE